MSREKERSDGAGKVWTCKIGETGRLPMGADAPMRSAVRAAYLALIGEEPEFLFSGWGGELTELERAVVENREPRRESDPLGSLDALQTVQRDRDEWKRRAEAAEAAVSVARAEERERCALAVEAEVEQAAGTLGELAIYAVCAETIRQLGGGPCEN